MKTSSVNGVTYNLIEAGHGEPLVLLHGFTGSAANWRPFIADFAQDWHVCALDLLGHGDTDCPDDYQRYAMPQAAADIIELIGQPFHLLGYSMGGRLALYLALHYPAYVKSLILESASPGLATATERAERANRDNQLADRIERDGITAFVDFWETLPLWDSQAQLTDAVRHRLRQQRLQNNPQGLANSLRGMGTGVMPNLWHKLETLTLPVCLLVGALDDKFLHINLEMQSKIADANLRVVTGAGHTTHLEKPAEYQQIVREFVTMLA